MPIKYEGSEPSAPHPFSPYRELKAAYPWESPSPGTEGEKARPAPRGSLITPLNSHSQAKPCTNRWDFKANRFLRRVNPCVLPASATAASTAHLCWGEGLLVSSLKLRAASTRTAAASTSARSPPVTSFIYPRRRLLPEPSGTFTDRHGGGGGAAVGGAGADTPGHAAKRRGRASRSQ